MDAKLIYVHDPMCSWCWGFSDVYQQLIQQLPTSVSVERLLGGLAADSDVAMPEATRVLIQQAWKRIEAMIPGKRFNYDFWTQCTPRRATYPACRAVIAARQQGAEFDLLMTHQIQTAYYQQARNPSEPDCLIELAAELGLDASDFALQLAAWQTQQQLLDDIQRAHSIQVYSFPSLVLEYQGKQLLVQINYQDVQPMLEQINQCLES